MARRRVKYMRLLPLLLLIAIGIPALYFNSSSGSGLPDLSVERAKAIVTSDIQRRFSAPYVTNEVTWRSFDWKGEGLTDLGAGASRSTFPARFAQVDLVWTQTTRSPDATPSHAEVFRLGYWNNGEGAAPGTALNVPSILVFYRTEQHGWSYTWQKTQP
ncbi:MAG: hypothetical protein WC005_01090 [Candidatus Nanopelagicales bacterium]